MAQQRPVAVGAEQNDGHDTCERHHDPDVANSSGSRLGARELPREHQRGKNERVFFRQTRETEEQQRADRLPWSYNSSPPSSSGVIRPVDRPLT